MKYKIFLVVITITLISCSEKKDVLYHKNGAIKFEVPLKDGKYNGLGKVYYSSGKLRGTLSYVDGLKVGIAHEYSESGFLISSSNFYRDKLIGEYKLYDSLNRVYEVTFYDSLGKAYDFYSFNEDGTRNYSFMAPIYNFPQDSVKQGIPTELCLKMGNVDSLLFLTGTLIITTEFDKNNLPIDTLALYEGANREGFHYSFTPKRKGENYVNGVLFFKSKMKSDLFEVPYRFAYKYEVY